MGLNYTGYYQLLHHPYVATIIPILYDKDRNNYQMDISYCIYIYIYVYVRIHNIYIHKWIISENRNFQCFMFYLLTSAWQHLFQSAIQIYAGRK